jgi:hypothetical protein
MRRLSITSILIALLLPVSAMAEDVHSILKKMQEKQIERWEGVNNYIVDQTTMGQRVTLGFEKTTVQGPDGEMHPMFRPAAPGSSEFATQLSIGAATAESALASKEEEMKAEGMPVDLLRMGGRSEKDPCGGEEAHMNFDPRCMMHNMAMFAAAGAKADDDVSAEDMSGMAKFAQRARLTGIVQVAGHDANHLIAEGLNQVQRYDGQEFRTDSVEMWVDTQEYVPLKFRMTGEITAEGKTRPMVIEKIDSDWRTVPDSRMYESYKQVMRISNVMTPEQQKQVQEAQKQMADLDEQMASMPASQRETMMRMMGPQLDMIRKMANGDGLEITVDIHRILVNPDEAAIASLQ